MFIRLELNQMCSASKSLSYFTRIEASVICCQVFARDREVLILWEIVDAELA